MKKLFDLELNEEMTPAELLQGIHAKLEEIEPKDEKEAYLITLVRNFKPLEEHDEEMKLLFKWGATEEKLWQVQI